MTNELSNLKYPKVFQYFWKISQIPRGSGNTAAITQYLLSFANEHKLEHHISGENNIIIIKDASPSKVNSPAIILQGHTDMVCEKKPDSNHDFSSDPLDLYIDGDFLGAKGTTLGGDDGIAVAYMLALLSDKQLELPRLECIFTYDEEIGMIGAEQIDLSPCTGKLMINLDSETEGEFIIGCAGGVRLSSSFDIEKEEQEGYLLTISVSGLMGGHSGEAIHLGGANAIKLVGRFVNRLTWGGAFLVDYTAGNADNVIPKSCTAKLLLPKDNNSWAEEYINTVSEFIHDEYDGIESNLLIEYTIDSNLSRQMVVKSSYARNAIDALVDLQDGVIEWEADGLQVKTSTNLGIIKLTDATFSMDCLLRSSNNQEKEKLLEDMKKCVSYTGGKCSTSGSYSGWTPSANSTLQKGMVKLWKDMFGILPEVQSIHAGLECGILCGKKPDLDIVSIGPNILDIHTPDELLDIPSTIRVYEFLCNFLTSQ